MACWTWSVLVFVTLICVGTVFCQPRPGYNSSFKQNTDIITNKSIKEIVKRGNRKVVGQLMNEIRKGFLDLKREIQMEMRRRQDFEEKMEKCLSGAQQIETTSAPSISKTMKIPQDCPVGYSEFENHCYIFKTEKLKWDEARTACRDWGGYLVSINTEAEQNYLAAQIKKYYSSHNIDTYWVGMTVDGGKMVWDDGTTVSYTHWSANQPNCMNKDCKVFLAEYDNYRWEDAHSSYKYNYVCELDKTSMTEEGAALQTTVSSVVVPRAVPVCPRGFVGFEGHCYLFAMKKMAWGLAMRTCRRKGGYLASVNTQREQDFLVTKIRSMSSNSSVDGYWLGMMSPPGKLTWSDLTDVIYTQWGPGEPQCMDTTLKCRVFISEYLDYRWEDASRFHKYFSICELEV